MANNYIGDFGKLLTISAKNFTTDISQGPEYASGSTHY